MKILQSGGYMFSRSRSWGVVGMLVMLVACGCGPKVNNTLLAEPKQNLMYILAAYQEAQTMAGGQGPKNWEQLTTYLAIFGDAEKIKISPRDNQEYQVVWGIDNSAASSLPIVAYETTGVDGVHLAVDSRPSIRELSDAEVEKLNKGTQPQPTMLKE